MADEKAADNMNPRVIGLRTVNKFSTFLLFLNLENNFDIIVRPINAKIVTPIVAAREPKKPAVLNPTNVALFIATGPGVDCDIASNPKTLD